MAGIERLNREKLIDKLGERWLFEKKATFLYDLVLQKLGSRELDGIQEKFRRFREQEKQHEEMLEQFIRTMGADPHARTHSHALVEQEAKAYESIVSGSDEPGTLVHCIFDLELEDNASWEMLMNLARDAKIDELMRTFEQALRQEHEHLIGVRAVASRLIRQELLAPLPSV